jgi:hypothetical protein
MRGSRQAQQPHGRPALRRAPGTTGSAVISLASGAVMHPESRGGHLRAQLPLHGLWPRAAQIAWRKAVMLLPRLHAHIAASASALLLSPGANRLAQASGHHPAGEPPVTGNLQMPPPLPARFLSLPPTARCPSSPGIPAAVSRMISSLASLSSARASRPVNARSHRAVSSSWRAAAARRRNSPVSEASRHLLAPTPTAGDDPSPWPPARIFPVQPVPAEELHPIALTRVHKVPQARRPRSQMPNLPCPGAGEMPGQRQWQGYRHPQAESTSSDRTVVFYAVARGPYLDAEGHTGRYR